MKMLKPIVFVLCAAAATLAGAAERKCTEVPASGDPGDAGSGLVVTVRLFPVDDPPMEITFDVGVRCFTWTRTADADDRDDQDGHLHYNAADRTAYADGTFRWREYGPAHSQREINERCAAQNGGTTKYATTSDVCEDHHGLTLKVVKVESHPGQ